MKKVVGIIICCCTFSFSFAQQQNDRINRTDGSLQYFYTTTEIDGTPFLKDSWTKAYALTADGYRFPKQDVKFDTYNGKFIYNKNDTSFEFTPQVTAIYMLPNENDTSKKIIFARGFSISNRISNDKFVQVLADGKASLLKVYKKEIEDYEVYGDAKKHQRYKATEQYFLLVAGQYTQVKLNKKELENALSSKAAEISVYMQKNNISGKDENSWVNTVGYFNTL